jgi:nucleolar protein 56
LSTLIGETVAARLIQKAGSLTSLAKCPASTVQILGAEKALFRALKTKGNTPKYGLIYHSTFIGRASAKNKGRISRYLANKCSIASRIDSFIEEPTNAYGLELREQVEERLKFYDSGDMPRKNIDVMSGVASELRKLSGTDIGDSTDKKKSKAKKDKKDKKRPREEDNEDEEVAEEVTSLKAAAEDEGTDGKKKKKSKKEVEEVVADESSSKKKKKVVVSIYFLFDCTRNVLTILILFIFRTRRRIRFLQVDEYL